MADTPQFLTLKDNRDDRGRVELALRRALLGLIVLVLLLGLFNVWGQRERGTVAQSARATFAVTAPHRVRGGLFYQGRFTISAREDIDAATVVLDRGWLEGMHINTIEPSPVGEASRDGKLALDFGHVGAGDRIIAYLQFQVNPTNSGRRSQDAALYDGEELIARVDRTVTVFP